MATGCGLERRPGVGRRAPRWPVTCILGGVGALALVAPRGASAYGVVVHRELARLALPGGAPASETALRGDSGDLPAFRIWLYGRLAATPDPALRGRLVQRYPTAEAFADAAAFKGFLSLSSEAQVFGIDRMADEAWPRLDLLARASAWPDEDRRNQDRFARGADGRVRRDGAGRPFPQDPAILWFGEREGLSSQAHAHYGLTERAHSDDPAVLKEDPVRFTLPKEAQAFGQGFASSYTALALAAGRWGGPSSRALATTFEGAAFHHLQDVCNQIHTVQVGLYDFFVAAKVQSLLEDLETGGGLWGPRRGFKSIGVGILSNHHLLSEQLLAKRLREAAGAGPGSRAPDPVVGGALPAIGRNEGALGGTAEEAARAPFGRFARALFQGIVEQSAAEGVEVYRLTRAVAHPRLSRRGNSFRDEVDDPDLFLKPGAPGSVRAELDELYRLQARGLGRAGEAMRLWEERAAAFAHALPADGGDDAALQSVLDVFLEERLAALDGEEARLAAWTPPVDADAPPALWVWGVYTGILGFAAGVAMWVRRRRRARTALVPLGEGSP